MLLCSLYYFYRSFKEEIKIEKKLMLGFSAFFLGLALTRIFYFTSDFFLVGGYFFFNPAIQGTVLVAEDLLKDFSQLVCAVLFYVGILLYRY